MHNQNDKGDMNNKINAFAYIEKKIVAVLLKHIVD